MLTKGPAKKVTIFINEDTQYHMTALHDSIMTFLMHKGVSGRRLQGPFPDSARTRYCIRRKSRF